MEEVAHRKKCRADRARLGALFVGMLIVLAACEDKPLPLPPPDFGKMEALAPSPEAAAAQEQKKAEQETPVVDGAVRLRWKVPEGQKVRALALRYAPIRKGSRPMRFDRQNRSRLSRKARRMFERTANSGGGVSEFLARLRHKDREYGSLAMDYILGRVVGGRAVPDKRLAKKIKALAGKPLLTAEIAGNGAVISVDSPLDTDSISAGGHVDSSGIAIENRYEGDLTLHTILLEMPAERVRVGDTWSFQVKHFSSIFFSEKKRQDDVKVELVALDEKEGQVLARLKYDVRIKLAGQWLKLGRKPIPQTFTTTFRGRGTFDAAAGTWRTFQGQYWRSGKGLMDFAKGSAVTIKALDEVPEGLVQDL